MGTGQVSMEYLMVASFALLITIPIIITFYLQSGDINDDINLNQVDQVARKVIDTAESVYYLGSPSKTTLKVYMPPHVKEVGILSRDLSFNITTQAGIINVVRTSNVNMTGNISEEPGIHHLEVRADPDIVRITDLDWLP